MDVAKVLREARGQAALTQSELARRAATAQSAVAAYERGTRTPTLGTLERLLRACDVDVELAVRPHVRRGAASLAALAPVIAGDLAAGRDEDARRLLFGFADDFWASSRPGRIALIAEEPPPTGAARYDAALAGMAEFFAAEAAIPVPAWVDGPNRLVEPRWFVASRPAFHAYTLAHTPAAFARHGVFVAHEVFDRV